MRVWYSAAPWWMRWLIMSAGYSVAVGLFYWAILLARPHWWTPWPTWVTVGGLIVVGSAMGAAAMRMQLPYVTSHAAVLDGLSKTQRRAVARALRRGSIPTDPAVLTAAVRVTDLAGSYRQTYRRLHRIMWVLIAAGAVLIALSQFLDHKPRAGMLYLILFGAMLGASLGPNLSLRRRRGRIAALRDAASADAAVSAALAAGPPVAVSTARAPRVRIGGALLVGALAAGASMLVIAVGDRSCQTARAAVRDIGEHWELLDPKGIAPGGPELGEYRAWTQRLQGCARRIGEPVLKSQLEHIAALSDAGRIVEQTRTPGSSAGGAANAQDSYLKIAVQVVEADKRLLQTCNR